MYYKELPCIYHPQLNITNFCHDQQCLMPLCPSCIREHTQYHEQQKTKPSYFNIYEALAQTDTLITNSICNLQKDKKRNSELIYIINRLPGIIHQKIQQSKTIAYKIIEQSFLQLERDTLEAVKKINQQLNMHSLRKSETYQQDLVSNLQDLYDLAQGLKNQTCLSDMIFFLKQKRVQVEDIHNDMSHYLYANQSYQPFIQISKQAQQSLSVIVQRMFKLDPKQKNLLNRNINLKGQSKNLHENSYHISLTPSKVKKPLYSLQKGSTVNPTSKYGATNNILINIRPKNAAYENYNQYQEYIIKSRQNSRQKNQRIDDNSFKYINIKQKQRKRYYEDIEERSIRNNLNNELTKRDAGVRYNQNRF